VVRDDERLERGDCDAERSRERSRERGADELVLELSRESDEISPTSAAVVAQQTTRLLRARVPGSSGSCPVAMGGLACEGSHRSCTKGGYKGVVPRVGPRGLAKGSQSPWAGAHRASRAARRRRRYRRRPPPPLPPLPPLPAASSGAAASHQYTVTSASVARNGAPFST